MSAAKHTAGPWSPNWEDADCNCLVILGLGRPVAQVIHDDVLDGDLDETDKANARLIAAAPDLLKAAEKYAMNYVQDEANERECCISDEQHEDAKALFAAIRLTKGE